MTGIAYSAAQMWHGVLIFCSFFAPHDALTVSTGSFSHQKAELVKAEASLKQAKGELAKVQAQLKTAKGPALAAFTSVQKLLASQVKQLETTVGKLKKTRKSKAKKSKAKKTKKTKKSAKKAKAKRG
jgi:hypothetical protein